LAVGLDDLFARWACEGLLPRQWLLVGNGRGDITHESFRARVHDALSEFGPKPEGRDWDSFAQRVFFAGGGFSPASPGSLPDVLGQARASLGGSPQLVHYLAVPPVAFGGLTQALGQYGLADGARVVRQAELAAHGEQHAAGRAHGLGEGAAAARPARVTSSTAPVRQLGVSSTS